MLLIKRCRAPQDGIVEIITQIGDHAEAGVIDQIGSRIIQDSFENGGSHKGEGNDCPRILEVRRNELLQVDHVAGSGQFEELHLAGGRARIQHPVEDRSNKQHAEGVEQTNRGH